LHIKHFLYSALFTTFMKDVTRVALFRIIEEVKERADSHVAQTILGGSAMPESVAHIALGRIFESRECSFLLRKAKLFGPR